MTGGRKQEGLCFAEDVSSALPNSHWGPKGIKSVISAFCRASAIPELEPVQTLEAGSAGVLRHQILDASCALLGGKAAWERFQVCTAFHGHFTGPVSKLVSQGLVFPGDAVGLSPLPVAQQRSHL